MADENDNVHTDQDDITIEPENTPKKKKTDTDIDSDTDGEFVPEDGEGNTGTTGQDTISNLRDKLKKAVAEKQEYLDGWQRTRADFTNARKREEESRKEMVKYANEDLIMQLMPVLDSFGMAFQNKEAWEKVDKNWRVGVEYIHSQLLGVLTQNNFSEFNPVGEKFDPMKEVALETVSVTDENQDHKILEVVQKSLLHDQR